MVWSVSGAVKRVTILDNVAQKLPCVCLLEIAITLGYQRCTSFTKCSINRKLKTVAMSLSLYPRTLRTISKSPKYFAKKDIQTIASISRRLRNPSIVIRLATWRLTSPYHHKFNMSISKNFSDENEGKLRRLIGKRVNLFEP